MSSASSATAPSHQTARPLVSIVITNYNYGRYLRDRDRQRARADLSECRSDRRRRRLDRRLARNNRIVRHSASCRCSSANGGHGSALNAGFAASRGEIVMFLDADDELLPDAAAQVVEAWRPSVAKAQFQLEMIDDRGNSIGTRVPPFNGFVPNGDIRDRIERFGEYPSSPSSGNAYARAALNRLMPLDEATWFAAAEKPLVFLTPFFGDVVSICAPLGRYRIHPRQRLAPQGPPSRSAASAPERGVLRAGDDLRGRKVQRDRARSAGARFNFAADQAADGVVAARSEDSSDRRRHARSIAAEGIKSVDPRARSELSESGPRRSRGSP